MTSNERPLNKNDYERLYAVLYALETKIFYEDDREPWQILHDFHAQENGLTEEEATEFVGPEAIRREIRFAQILSSILKRGGTTIDDRIYQKRLERCSVTGCREFAYGGLKCLNHQLED